MLGPSSHLVGAIDKLPFISCAKNTTGAHCSEAGFPMMRGSAIAIAPVGIDDVVRIPEGLNEGTLAALLGRRHRGIRKSGGSRQQQTKSEAEENQELTRLNSTEHNPLQSRGVSVAACCDYLPAKSI